LASFSAFFCRKWPSLCRDQGVLPPVDESAAIKPSADLASGRS
jgi:phosphatidylserine decarboxylase